MTEGGRDDVTPVADHLRMAEAMGVLRARLGPVRAQSRVVDKDEVMRRVEAVSRRVQARAGADDDG